MRKYLWIAVIALIACTVYFTSCERIPKEVMDTIMPDAEQVEPPPETVETPPETPTETPPVVDMEPADVETPPVVDMEPTETTEPTVDMEPAETVDLTGGTVDIEDAMSTIGLRKIYWSDGEWGEIRRGNPDGSGIETSGVESVLGLVIDIEGGKLYWRWSGIENDSLARANLDGTNIEHLGKTPVQSFSLDLEAGKIYWSTGDREHLFQRSNLDGSGVEKFKTSAVQALLGTNHLIAFHPINRKIYAVSNGKMFVINADDLDIKFADIETELTFPHARSLILDIEDSKIYWVGGGVYRANLDGTNVEQLVSGGDAIATVDFNTRKIYWVDNQQGRKILWQANLDDGSNPEGLFVLDAEYGLTSIAVETGPIN